ncbi:hypothetical protein ACCO45_007783 [Purpureocillium lilacinum]|uniref:Uncharacterized protein n=1 Tax=Purpureocillium lilacinum TaxID=33203 RepID=A0ACC4DLF6_PURLI
MADSTKLLEEHKAAVARIQKQVKHFYDNKKHFRVYHGSTSSTRPLQFQRDAIVDTSDMGRLFPVNLETMTVQAEPKVPMDALAAHCLAKGVIPKIVMEFKGITVGGGYSGFSGESSMYRYGLFNNTVSDIEIVLGDGSLETASRTHNADLLEHAAGSLGTFGIVDLQLVEDVTKAHDIFEAATLDDAIHFIDGVYFRKGRIAVMFARFVDKAPSPDKVLKKMQVHWFADTIEDILDKRPTAEKPTSIYMTTTDYLFRYDHGAFWGGKLAFKHFHVPQNSLTRRLADPFLDSRTCYHALHKSGLANEYVVQDFGIPASTVTEFISYAPRDIGLSSRFNERVAEVADQRIFAVGVYGRGPRDPKAFYELNRKLELRSAELLGAKLLYARTYYTEDEFWLIYRKDIYEEMRKKYKAETLPTVFQKLQADMDTGAGKRRPVRGILETMWDKVTGNKEYLLKK